MTIRLGLMSLALLALLVPATHAQTRKVEILWQFEAGG
jgi:hypothetical protein